MKKNNTGFVYMLILLLICLILETASAQQTDLSLLDGTNGFVIVPPDDTGDFGASMANAGDVNGDGIEDLIIGHPRADIGGELNAGQAYVIYGTTSAMPDTLKLADITSSDGFVLNGIADNDQAGNKVTGNFDINDDGYDDIAVSAPFTDPGTLDGAGSVYVVFGGASLPAEIELDGLDGTDGFRYDGDNADEDYIGLSLSPAGDYNDDGIDDLMIGAPLYDDPGDPNSGAVFFIFGQTTAFSSIESADLSFIHGVDGDQQGRSVAMIGNFFGDDKDAIAIGQYRADTGADGETGLGLMIPNDRVNLTSLGSSYGFGLVGEDTNDNLGWSVAGIGDFDQDGLDDVLWGATQADGISANSGEGYIMYGRDDTGYDFLSVNGKTGYPSFSGTTIRGIATPDGVGDQVSYAGDITDDGFPDALIAAQNADPNGNSSAGEVYLVKGGSRTTTIDLNTTSRVITFAGTEAGDKLGSSLAGLDFNDDGVNDIMMGAGGLSDGGGVYVVFGETDETPPLLTEIYSASAPTVDLRDAVDVSTTAFTARLLFDEIVSLADDGAFYIVKSSDSSVVSTMNLTADVSINSGFVDVPISGLEEYTRYSLIIPDSVIVDNSKAINAYEGALTLSTIQFRTEGEAPFITYGGGYDLANASLTGNYDISINDPSAQGLAFSSDGSFMYTSSSSDIDQYALSTPFDISTATYDGTRSFSDITTAISGLAFNESGTKLYLVDVLNDQIVQLTVSSSFDINGTVTNDDTSLDISAEENFSMGVAFSPDGFNLFISSSSGQVTQYELFTSFDLEDGAADIKTFDFSSQMSRADGIAFNDDGTEMYLVSNTIDAVTSYTFTSAFDISSSSTYNGELIDLSIEEAVSTDMAVSPDGRYLYVVGIRNDMVLSYDISGKKIKESIANDGSLTGSVAIILDGETFSNDGGTLIAGTDYTITGLPTGLNSLITVASDGISATLTLSGSASDHQNIDDIDSLTFDFESSAFDSFIASDIVGVEDEEVSIFIDFNDNPSILYGLSFTMDGGATAVGTYDVNSVDNGPNGLYLSSDGTHMFIPGIIGDAVYHYSLENAFDISSGVSLEEQLDISDEEGVISGVSFSPDGFIMHIIGTSDDEINQYSLTSAFDLSTAEVDGSPLDITDSSFPEDLAFGNNGSNLYVVSASPDDEILQYSLSTPYDISTASFSQSLDVSSFDGGPTGLAFDVLGKKLFMVGVSNDQIYEFDLSTAWDVSTATLKNTLEITAEGNLEGIAFNTDGTSVFVVGNSTDLVRQYELTKPGFSESESNNGSVDGSMTFVMAIDTFENAGSTLTHLTDYTIDNLPAGLTPNLTVDMDGLSAVLTFTGQATNNDNTDDLGELLFTFENSALVGGNASALKNMPMTGGNVGIDFDDNVVNTWIGGASGAANDWDTGANWSTGTVPEASENVVIATTSFDPVISSTTLATLLDLTVESGASLTVESGGSLAIYGEATIDGTYQINRNTTGSAGYSIVSSPVEDFAVSALGADYLYEFDGASYVEPAGNMEEGTGYFVGYDAMAPSIAFIGNPNTGSVSKSVTSGNFELVGNPFSAPVSIEDFLTDNSAIIAGAVYFWDDGGTNVGGSRGGDYVTANALGAVSAVQPDGIEDGVDGLKGTTGAENGVIPSAQGAYVEAITTGNVTFSAGMQELGAGLNDDANFYRKAADITKVKIIASGTDFYDEALIGFLSDATLGRDTHYDARKFSDQGLSSMIGEDRFAIQGLPLIEEEMYIPLLLEASTGVYDLALHIEGLSDVYDLSIKDLSNQVIYELGVDHSVQLTTIGEQTELLLTISPKGVLSQELELFQIMPTLSNIDFYGVTTDQALVGLYSLDGRILFSELIDFNKGKASIEVALQTNQLYIVKIGDQHLKFIINQ